MTRLAPHQRDSLRALFAALPDPLLMRLGAALAAARRSDPAYGPVAEIARAESLDRETRDLVLAPLRPLADAAAPAPKRPILAPGDPARVWALVRAEAPGPFAAAVRAAHDQPDGEVFDRLADELCLAAARLLPAADPDRLTLRQTLALAPVLRRVQSRLPGWMRQLGPEATAALRLAYKDALAISEESGPLFLEALFLYLEEPARLLRLISALVVERPSDRYLAATELAGLGERLLEDVEARVAAVAAFDPVRGFEGGAAEGASVRAAATTLREFDDWIDLAPDGPWGRRVRVARQRLLAAVEERLRGVEPAVAAALPVQAERAAGALTLRPAPRIDGPPDEVRVRRAEALLAFCEEVRAAAPLAGFEALRNRAADGAASHIEAWAEDLIDRLREGRAGDPDWARAFVETAADLAGLVSGPERAQILRRRAAA